MTTDTPPLTAEQAEQYLPETLRRPPIFHLLMATPAGKQQLSLIRTRVAKGATDSEVAQFLELCAQYGLDWNADEAWCAVSNPDDPNKRRVLLMVGRNGLRKIAQRQGLDFDGDVVRANDIFTVKRNADRTREIVHEYEEGADDTARGPMRGAWCEVYEVATGRQRGYFYARVEEYRPTGAKLQYSPWGSQESVMMQTAAERQALGQATPLGGVVGQGDLDRPNEVAEIAMAAEDLGRGDGNGGPVDLPDDVAAIVERARALGHAGLANAQSAAMALDACSPERVAAWVANATAQLDAFEQAKAEAEIDTSTEPPPPPQDDITDADVVPEVKHHGDVREEEDALVAGAVKAMLDTAERLESEAEQAKEAGREEDAVALFEEAGRLRSEAAAASDDGQESMPL